MNSEFNSYYDERHVGFDVSSKTLFYNSWMCPSTVERLSGLIHNYLASVGMGHVRVTDRSVWAAMNTVYQRYIPPQGDIFTTFTMNYARNDIELLSSRVVELVTSAVLEDHYFQYTQNQYNIWDSVHFGAESAVGIQQTPPIKLNQNRIPFSFINQRY